MYLSHGKARRSEIRLENAIQLFEAALYLFF